MEPGGMMGMMGGPFPAVATPITVDDAVRVAEQPLQNLGNPDLTFDHVHAFALTYYVAVKAKSMGRGAFKPVIDRIGGGAAMPPPGSTMMWNTKYGVMAGGPIGPGGMVGPGGMHPDAMMGPGSQPGDQATPAVAADTPIERDQAVKLAQDSLASFLPGVETGAVHDFYGYRTVFIERDGRLEGMLSVNGFTGAIWYHTWHGESPNRHWDRPH